MKAYSKLIAIAIVATLFAGCKKDQSEEASGESPTGETITAERGVNVEEGIIRIGVLNDESGPAAVIGRPFAIGKRLLAAHVNAGDSGILPEGWTIELVERDHGYNPQQSVAAYNEIKDDVLFIGTSFGTPNTLPLRPMLERDGVVAFPASLSSEMAADVHTPPVGPSYKVEAMRAMVNPLVVLLLFKPASSTNAMTMVRTGWTAGERPQHTTVSQSSASKRSLRDRVI